RNFACTCGERFAVEVWRAVDARRDPEVARELCAGKLNRAHCPACNADFAVQVTLVYHDPIGERLVLVLPDGLRHRELEERGRLYLRLASDGAAAPEYVRRFEVVFGFEELSRLVRPEAPTEATAVVPFSAVAEAIARPAPPTVKTPTIPAA